MMNKFLTILISCSLTLAATAMAQQDEEQQQIQKKNQSEKASPAKGAKPAGNAESARKEHAETKAVGPAKATPKPESTQPAGKVQAETKAPAKPANANRKEQTEQRKNERTATAPANKPATPSPAAATAHSPAAAAAQANKPNAAKKPDAQAIQSIKAEHASFRAQAKPEQVPAVTFNQNYRISGVERWQGPQYEVFRSYRPEMHDQGWYRSRYNRVELIGGGYYYFNNGYWYPAWGYDPGAQYYAYDAPIYVGHGAEPPDRVIADVQASLQELGYYKGEVDGLLGPLTREALTAYQSDHGLYATSVIDQPTLDSLGMG